MNLSLSLWLLCVATIAQVSADPTNRSYQWDFGSAAVSQPELRATPDSLPISLPWSSSFQFETKPPQAWSVKDDFLKLNASNQQVSALPAGLPVNQLTIAAWVRPDQFAEWMGIFSALQDNGGEETGVLLGLNNQSFCAAIAGTESSDADGTLHYITADNPAQLGRWYLVCLTYDGREQILYVDGQVVARANQARGGVRYPTDPTIGIGGYVDINESYPFRGAIKQLWIDGAAWTSDKVTAVFEQTRAQFPEPETATETDSFASFPIEELTNDKVGVMDGTLAPNYQLIRPAGKALTFRARPVDAAISPTDDLIAVKDNRGVVVFDSKTWRAVDNLPFQEAGASMHGVRFSDDGQRFWVTTAQDRLYEAHKQNDRWTWRRTISLPGPDSDASHALGIAFDAKRERLFVCLSRNNSVAEIDLNEGKIVREIPVGVAPYDVLYFADREQLVVSNWGGRRPREDEPSATSSGTEVLIDDRGVAASGTVGLVDLTAGRQVKQIHTGLHPADLVFDHRTDSIIVANANSDTVVSLDSRTLEIRQTVVVRPNPKLPYGSATNAIALSPDGKTLYAANAGNNAIAVLVRPETNTVDWELTGFIPTAWYPTAVAAKDDAIFVVNTKGMGSRYETAPGKYGVKNFVGAVQKIDVPSDVQLESYTAQVISDARVPGMLAAFEKNSKSRATDQGVDSGDQPRVPEIQPVPASPNIISPIKYVVYVIKENRTYDQIFGDLPQGDGEPGLCDYPRQITPNHHAIAEQFVLLDNFYCNGVNSADGHAWATEGNVTDYLEKSFGGFTRSYTFGDDPLSYSSTGFIWDKVLLGGLTFRNYGEMDYSTPIPSSLTFKEIYDDFASGTRAVKFDQNIGIESLARYSCREYPGWNMKIPDVLRAQVFIDELKQAEADDQWYNFSIVYLPQDHTSGLSEGAPRPEAHMADNDLALGRVIEALSNSKFWPETCVFVVEDDPQAGYDHIDGHRSICLLASPWVKRGQVISEFYNQTSVLHTMQRILSLTPMNQMDAAAPIMFECFTDQPDLTPYRVIPANIPLDSLGQSRERAEEGMQKWYVATEGEDFEGFDRADEDTLNRILWHAQRGPDAPYPAHLAGPHGTGLKSRGLEINPFDDDDDD